MTASSDCVGGEPPPEDIRLYSSGLKTPKSSALAVALGCALASVGEGSLVLRRSRTGMLGAVAGVFGSPGRMFISASGAHVPRVRNTNERVVPIRVDARRVGHARTSSPRRRVGALEGDRRRRELRPRFACA